MHACMYEAASRVKSKCEISTKDCNMQVHDSNTDEVHKQYLRHDARCVSVHDCQRTVLVLNHFRQYTRINMLFFDVVDQS